MSAFLDFSTNVYHNISKFKYFLLRKTLSYYPPGHFHSPIPSLAEIKLKEDVIWRKPPERLDDVDLHVDEQLQYLNDFAKFYPEMPFSTEKQESLRFYFHNGFFFYSDAICLYSMMRTIKPKRIIEIGSGHSSALMMDTNQLFLNNEIEITFCEPNPERLQLILRKDDNLKYKILVQKVQDIDLNLFLELQENDFLFIDSSHVSKVGSDVHHILFNILPKLRKGVYVHFHDIFYPFEYPKEWIYWGWAWNECYLLRAFLSFNRSFKIVFFNSYIEKCHREEYLQKMPLCVENNDKWWNESSSLWIKKV